MNHQTVEVQNQRASGPKNKKDKETTTTTTPTPTTSEAEAKKVREAYLHISDALLFMCLKLYYVSVEHNRVVQQLLQESVDYCYSKRKSRRRRKKIVQFYSEIEHQEEEEEEEDMGILHDDVVIIRPAEKEGEVSLITVNCPDKTGLGCDLCRIILFFGLSIVRGGTTQIVFLAFDLFGCLESTGKL